MIDILQYEFMQNAVLASILGGAACSLIGVLVVTLDLSFIGTCMAHAALAGAILGVLFGLPPLVVSFLFCCLAAGLVGPLADKGKFRPDTALAIIFSLSQYAFRPEKRSFKLYLGEYPDHYSGGFMGYAA